LFSRVEKETKSHDNWGGGKDPLIPIGKKKIDVN